VSSFRRVFRLALGDFQERSKRFSFLLTLAFVLYAAFLFLPPNHARYATLQFGGHRGIYNSAWVGTLVALHSAVFLSLAGFYLVKNGVARDRSTGVGEVLAATRLSNLQYMLSKTLSNFLVLFSMVVVMVIAASAMQLVRQEENVLRLPVLLAPFLFLTLPLMALVAAVAALFESLLWLRGGLGNIIYYFIWTAMLATSAIRAGSASSGLDPVGFHVAAPQMAAACAESFPDYDREHGGYSMGFNIRADGETWALTTFTWDGVVWTWPVVMGRFLWIGIAFATVLVAGLIFDRFDPARDKSPARSARAAVKDKGGPIDRLAREIAPRLTAPASGELSYASLTPFSGRKRAGWAGQTARLVASELSLALLGVSRWWYAVAAGASAACLFAPMEVVRAFFFPLAWIWPILIWSALGTREVRYGTDALLYSAPRPLARQLPAIWLAGVIIAAATGAGMALRLLVAGDLASIGAWFVGALFISSFALFLGSASGQSKLFELLYLVLWYVGPLNKAAFLDFMGTTRESQAAGAPKVFAFAAAACLIGGFAARRLRLRN
jgi:hypothetical protein